MPGREGPDDGPADPPWAQPAGSLIAVTISPTMGRPSKSAQAAPTGTLGARRMAAHSLASTSVEAKAVKRGLPIAGEPQVGRPAAGGHRDPRDLVGVERPAATHHVRRVNLHHLQPPRRVRLR